MTHTIAGADFLAALLASCFRGTFPPVDMRAVCFVRAMGQCGLLAAEWELKKMNERTPMYTSALNSSLS